MDSRITQAVAEVSAAIELLKGARRTVEELLEEDPAFGPRVRDALHRSNRYLFFADTPVQNGLLALKTADASENGAASVPNVS